MIARTARCSRGVSLVEALVAMAVMGIGMLGIVGMQATLRGNSDLSKQRAEAVRFAQRAIEEWRGMTALVASPGRIDYETDLVTGGAAIIAGTNASYTVTRNVVPMDGREAVPSLDTVPRAKSLRVTVSWEDRAGQTQSVVLASAIAGIAPELAATLAVPADGDPVRRPFGRSRGIPLLAKDLGDGTSALKPPGAPGDVAWRFDNVTALITLCTTTAASTDAIIGSGAGVNLACGDENAFLLAGFVRYATQAAQPTATDEPASDPLPLEVWIDRTAPSALQRACYIHSVAVPSTYTAYHCAVPIVVQPAPTPTVWSGRVFFKPDALFAPDAADPARPYKVCRYFADGGVVSGGSYSDVGGPLVNQNYLVVRAGNDCPSPPTVAAAHQSAAYPPP